MNKYDLEHKLLKGSPLFLGDIPTYKITLGEMADNGFTRMQNVISLLCMDDEKAKETFGDSVESPSAFLFIAATIYQEYEAINNQQIDSIDMNNLFCISIPSFLSLFFRKDVVFDKNYGFVIGNDTEEKYFLNDTNYDSFRTILKERNCLLNIDGVDQYDNPDNEMARKLLEKRKNLHQKLNKAKEANGESGGLTMADLISIFAEAEHMPLQDIYEKYDVYQFDNQFNRLKIMDDFHINIQALLAGAKSEDIKLQHWLSKIKTHDN